MWPTTLINIDNDSKLNVTLKPIAYVTPHTEECCLCCSSYQDDVPIVECHVCHQHLHCNCQIQWCVTNILNEQSPTCPFCRSDWENNQFLLYPNLDIS